MTKKKKRISLRHYILLPFLQTDSTVPASAVNTAALHGESMNQLIFGHKPNFLACSLFT